MRYKLQFIAFPWLWCPEKNKRHTAKFYSGMSLVYCFILLLSKLLS